MYNNYNPYNAAPSMDRINAQINELERMKSQLQNQQPMQPSINQTFQLAPNQPGLKTAETIEEVNKEFVVSDTPFFNKDMTIMWIKNIKNEIRTFNLMEIIPKDEKDLIIEQLQKQIEEMANDEKQSNGNANESTESKKSTRVSTNRANKK